MIGVVLDASLTLSWCFADEADAAAWAVLTAIERDGAVVPSLWPVEVANGLARAERRGRLSRPTADAFLHALEALAIGVDGATHRRAFDDMLGLAREHRVTAYDACYIELALRAGLPLATVDAGMRAAARRLGLAIVP